MCIKTVSSLARRVFLFVELNKTSLFGIVAISKDASRIESLCLGKYQPRGKPFLGSAFSPALWSCSFYLILFVLP